MPDQPLLFAQRLRAGQRLLGSFVFLPSPGAVEILGHAGLDFVIIDQEHSPKSWEMVENMVRAAEVCGMAALIRVARIEEKEILHALEVGAACRLGAALCARRHARHLHANACFGLWLAPLALCGVRAGAQPGSAADRPA
jgi:2-keto-3-deoxy-L-rhamnonate aldolase RhmA